MGCGLPNAGAWECPTPQNQLPNSEDCYTRSLHYHRTVEVLTEWTVSLASSALHLKGLSQQVTFLLDEKEINAAAFVRVFFSTRAWEQWWVSPPRNYHEIPPPLLCFCTSALQCSWADLITLTAKSCSAKRTKNFRNIDIMWVEEYLR